jgi:riboflavin transporter
MDFQTRCYSKPTYLKSQQIMKEPGFIKKLLQISLLSSIGAVLMLWQIPYPGAPGILQFDISNAAVLIGGFALGPWEGAVVLVLKNLIFLIVKFSPKEMLGIPMNTIYSAVLVLTAAYVYHRKKTWNNAILSLFSGIVTSTIFMIPANYFVLPVFIKIFTPEMPVPSPEKIMETVIFAVIPFNIINGTLNCLVTFFVYKRVGTFLKGTGRLKLSETSGTAESKG